MATGQLNISMSVTGGPDGARAFGPFTVTTQAAVTETLPVALANGANTITVPAGSTWCIISPPGATSPGTPNPNPGYGGVLTLKGVAGDTGTTISAKWWTVLTWDVGGVPASFVINATAVGTVTVIFG